MVKFWSKPTRGINQGKEALNAMNSVIHHTEIFEDLGILYPPVLKT